MAPVTSQQQQSQTAGVKSKLHGQQQKRYPTAGCACCHPYLPPVEAHRRPGNLPVIFAFFVWLLLIPKVTPSPSSSPPDKCIKEHREIRAISHGFYHHPSPARKRLLPTAEQGRERRSCVLGTEQQFIYSASATPCPCRGCAGPILSLTEPQEGLGWQGDTGCPRTCLCPLAPRTLESAGVARRAGGCRCEPSPLPLQLWLLGSPTSGPGAGTARSCLNSLKLAGTWSLSASLLPSSAQASEEAARRGSVRPKLALGSHQRDSLLVFFEFLPQLGNI